MLDLNYLRENIETARQRLASRGFLLDVETLQRLDGERKSIIHGVELLRQLRNSASEEIAKLLRDKMDITGKRNEMKLVSQQIKDKEEALRIVEEKLFQFASIIPNLPDPAVPVGPTDEQNVEVRRVGDPPRFDFSPKAHWDLCPPLGIFDLERATKIAGSRFPLLAGMGARLERALINFMLDIHTKERGYKEILPPFMANSASLFGTSQLPKFDEEDILKRLKLAYRVVIHSTGDMSFAASKSYDIEVWLPGQNGYREISSCSNFEDFQARRANIRYRPSGGGKVRFVHTLNGSGLAIGRTWIAIVENYQQKDGT